MNALFLSVILIILQICNCYDKEMTISVEAGNEDCFYQAAKIGETIDIEYQVIDGGHGDLDISFKLAAPDGRILFADFKKSDNVHRYEVKFDGDYRVCFDNRFSTFNKKTIFFELIVENENENNEDSAWQDLIEGLTPEEFYDVKVQDIQDAIGRVRQHLTKARQIQDILRSFEARDRNLAELNYFKVNSWSMFQICAMLVVGGIQVLMVRSIFDSDSKLHYLWKKIQF